MNKKKKVLIIGAGGIGSFLIPLLDRTKLYTIDVADPDKVEKKNLTYQNFKEKEVGQNKALCMSWNYTSVRQGIPYPILTEEQIKKYDIVICCADNLDVRRLLYRTKVNFLDLRSQGRNCAFVSHLADPNLYDTMLAGPEGSFSCQGDSWDGSNKNLHYMQVAIAGMGAEWLQRWFNDESVEPFKVVNV